jgi:hypothetical protein
MPYPRVVVAARAVVPPPPAAVAVEGGGRHGRLGRRRRRHLCRHCRGRALHVKVVAIGLHDHDVVVEDDTVEDLVVVGGTPLLP